MSNEYDCYSSYSWRNYEVTSGVCPGDLFLRKSVWQISHWKLLWWYLPRKKFSRRYPAQRQFFWGEIPQDTAFILKILCERYATKQSVKGNCLPNKLRMEISSKQIPKETSTKEYLEKPAYQKNQREISTKKIWREISPPKKSNNLSTNNYVKKFYQGNSEETFPAKLKNWNKNLSKHLSQETFPYQANWRNVSTKRASSEEKSLPKRMKKHLHQKIWENKHNK